MLINFKSVAKQEEDEKKIEFSSKLEFEENEEWYSYTFNEPSNKITNLIEVKKDLTVVKIFAGATSLELELENDVEIIYKIENSRMFLYTYMSKINFISKKELSFEYELKDNQRKRVGEFQIFLKVE